MDPDHWECDPFEAHMYKRENGDIVASFIIVTHVFVHIGHENVVSRGNS